jgi:hypothetical protein
MINTRAATAAATFKVRLAAVVAAVDMAADHHSLKSVAQLAHCFHSRSEWKFEALDF